jgi:hypothetical protein
LLWLFSRLEHREIFAVKCVSGGEATFHLSGSGNRHDPRISGKNNPHEMEETSDSLKLNVFYAMPKKKKKISDMLFFSENIVTSYRVSRHI